MSTWPCVHKKGNRAVDFRGMSPMRACTCMWEGRRMVKEAMRKLQLMKRNKVEDSDREINKEALQNRQLAACEWRGSWWGKDLNVYTRLYKNIWVSFSFFHLFSYFIPCFRAGFLYHQELSSLCWVNNIHWLQVVFQNLTNFQKGLISHCNNIKCSLHFPIMLT